MHSRSRSQGEPSFDSNRNGWAPPPLNLSASAGSAGAEPALPRRGSLEQAFGQTRRKLSISLNTSFSGPSAGPSSGEGSLNPFATIRNRKASAVDGTPSSPSPGPKKEDKGKLETRKLLLHLLDQLRRELLSAPSAFGPAPAQGKGKGKAFESDSSDEEVLDEVAQRARQLRRSERGPGWSEKTFELMAQLRDVLAVSDKKGWNLFSNTDGPVSIDIAGDASPPSPSRARFLRTNSGGTSPTRASSSQPSLTTGSALFISTVSLLSDVCLLAGEPIPSFRPSRPPLSLQSITLDVATVLVHCMRGRPQETAEVGLALLSALEVWGEGIKGRVLAFYTGMASDALEALQNRRRHQMHHLRPELRHTVRSSTRSSRAFRHGPVPPVAIQVDGPTEVLHEEETDANGAPMRRPSLTTVDITRRARSSTHAGDQPLTVYQLGSLVGPLITVALGSVSPLRSSVETIFRLHRLVERLVKLKDDFCLDVLDVVAYGNAQARYNAFSILATFWPKVVGQPRTAPAFSKVDYRDDTRRMDLGVGRLPVPASETVPHLVPWRFPGQGFEHNSLLPSTASTPNTFFSMGTPHQKVAVAHLCAECGQPVRGFGLLSLTGAYEPIHLQCYNSLEGSFISQYAAPNGQTRIAAPRFSLVTCSRRADLLPCDGGKAVEQTMLHPKMAVGRHRFQLVNLFSLLLCFVCRQPLWGTTLQGYKCSHCRHFAHHSCLHSAPLSGQGIPPCHLTDVAPLKEITIDHDALRRDFLAYYSGMIFDERQLRSLSYEEVGVLHATLWTQLQILEAGLASGTIVVDQVGPTLQQRDAVDKFELHSLVKLYGAVQPTLKISVAHDEFADLHGRHLEMEAQLDFFCLPLLSFVTALARSPAEDAQPDLLSTGAEGEGMMSGGQCFDELELSLVQDVLARDYNLRSTVAASIFMEHLLHLGLFERKDGRLTLAPPGAPAETLALPSTAAVFPLPSLIDPSPSVEALVAAIEACLADADLSVQESGLLLLCRRCWPSPFASPFALARLTRAVLGWLLDDSALFAAAAERVAHVNARYASPRERKGHDSIKAGGGDYVDLKNALTTRLAARWLRALHDQDEQIYADSLFEQTATLSAASRANEGPLAGAEAETLNEHTVAFTELLLKNLIRLHAAEVVFSTFEDLFSRWLDEVAATWQSLRRDDVPLSFRSLVRLFQSENSFTLHKRTGSNPALHSSPILAEPDRDAAAAANDFMVDPWLVLINTANEPGGGWSRAVRWLRILAQSGVDITMETLEHLLTLSMAEEISLAEAVDLSEAVFASTWSKNLNRPAVAQIAARLYTSRAGDLSRLLAEEGENELAIRFVQRTLGAFLLALGCAPETLVQLGFTTEVEARALGTNRRRGSFYLAGVREVQCDGQLISDLTKHAELARSLKVKAVIANFLYAALASKEALYSANLVVGACADTLAPCVLSLFDPAQSSLTDQRTRLLLTLLSVDGPAFHSHLARVCADPDWEQRFVTLDKLFLLVTELHIPATGNSPPGSLANFFPIVSAFFAHTCDVEEAVRTKVSTLIAALRPSHFATVAQALQARFNNGTDRDRIEICRFLARIRSVLPTWQVLTWASVLDALFTCELDAQISGYGATDDVDEHDELWLELLALGLMMVAEGIEVDRPSTLVKLKYHVLKALGFADVVLVAAPQGRGNVEVTFGRATPEPSKGAPVVLSALKRALDCPKQMKEQRAAQDDKDLTPRARAATRRASVGETASKKKMAPLVGAPLVDIIPSVVLAGVKLDKFDHGQMRDLLEGVLIILYKHEVEVDYKTAEGILNTVKNLTDLLLDESIAHDHKLLILTICLSLLGRYEQLNRPILIHQLLVVSQLMSNHPDDSITAQATAYLNSAFTRFGGKGLFVLLFKSVGELDDQDLAEKLLEVWWLVLRDGPSVIDSRLPQGAEMSLRESPLFEAFHSTQQLPSAAAAASLTKYALRANPAEWSFELLKQALVYFDKLLKLSADVDDEGWEPNATLELADLVWRAQPKHAEALLEQLASLVRSWTTRFVCTPGTIKLLVRPTTVKKLEVGLEQVVHALNEALIDALRGKDGTRLPTLGALLEALLGSCGSHPTRSAVRANGPTSGWNVLLASNAARYAEEGSNFLRHCWETQRGKYGRDAFEVIRLVGDLVLLCVRIEPGAWGALLGREPQATLRTVNFVLLSELTNPSEVVPSLMEHTAAISAAAALSLRACLRGADSDELSLATVAELTSQVFANVRLAQLLSSRLKVGGRATIEAHWVAVGAVAESVLSQSESEDLSPIEALLWAAFSDLILWLHQAGSPLVMTHASGWSGLLENLPRAHGSKVARAVASFADPPERGEEEALRRGVEGEVFVASKLLSANRSRDL